MNAEIRQRITFADGGAITLYDWMDEAVGDGRNLIRTDATGREIWRATPPLVGHNDCFTNILPDPHRLKLGTWCGYEVAVDVETGEVTVISFTK